MSLTSLLLAFAPALAARFEKPEKSARELELEAERDALKDELEHAWLDRDWHRAQIAEMVAREQRRNDLLPLPLGGQHALPQHPPERYAHEQWGHNALAQQANAQQASALQLQAQENAYRQGLQNCSTPGRRYCDCSPSRSAALLGVMGA
jgi:hypothetical protein